MPHETFMRAALQEAERAAALGEVPIGAVVVKDGQIIARAHNERESRFDATAHAEVLAIQRAGELLRNWRLQGATIYVTIEPCPMCAGALWQARVERVVFGATDPKAWPDIQLADILQNPGLNHRCEVLGGVLAAEAAGLMQAFFQQRRQARKTS